ncbi:hypothetical protein F511_10540 [Dorcoceras hygrometricum]|uniref:5'-3' exonuclease domain-containing protein n=1 Tax=Dorcoceras hygrometricum TaxID=472368 RepID=A0A2Z7CZY1_9LAMI|nr:hypothetical protein F511_10540 [Dorcoceras hygrometricum]
MAELLEAAMASTLRGRKELHLLSSFAGTQPPPRKFFLLAKNLRTQNVKSRKLLNCCLSASCSSQEAVGSKTLENEALSRNCNGNSGDKILRKRRVFLLDVNPLCYKGSAPSLESFAHWISIFFSQVSLNDPVIAVLDGESGNEHRRQILPTYKANRRRSLPQFAGLRSGRSTFRRSEKLVVDVLEKCNVPVVKIEGYEADDVVATLVEEVLKMGFRVAIASPDKDFKQLISEDVQIVRPVPEFDRWSFYTIKHYIAQHNCDPQSDLSLRCILGDEIDGVPGIQHLVPGFGRRTALKLLKKHGSLENLLSAAAVRTVGRQYAQEALMNHADFLRRNYEVLSLKR